MVGLGTYPVDAFQDFGEADDAQFKGAFAGKVHQHQPHENGEQSLSGESEHGNTCKNENKTKQVFQDQGSQAKSRVLILETVFGGLSLVEEIVLTHANEDEGSDDKGQQEHGN